MDQYCNIGRPDEKFVLVVLTLTQRILLGAGLLMQWAAVFWAVTATTSLRHRRPRPIAVDLVPMCHNHRVHLIQPFYKHIYNLITPVLRAILVKVLYSLASTQGRVACRSRPPTGLTVHTQLILPELCDSFSARQVHSV